MIVENKESFVLTIHTYMITRKGRQGGQRGESFLMAPES
jgi:hypothetical protein